MRGLSSKFNVQSGLLNRLSAPRFESPRGSGPMPPHGSIHTLTWSSQPCPAFRASEMSKQAADKGHPEDRRKEDDTIQGQRMHVSPPRGCSVWAGTQPARLFWSLIQEACLNDDRFVPPPNAVQTGGNAGCQWPIVCAHGRPAKMPVGGHENCPLMANEICPPGVRWRWPCWGLGLVHWGDSFSGQGLAEANRFP